MNIQTRGRADRPGPMDSGSAKPNLELSTWTRQLTEIAGRPLELCPGFPTIARRFEAWWEQDVMDRPVFIGMADTNPARRITLRYELLDDPDAWFEAKRADMQQMLCVGDAIPRISVDLGPMPMAGIYGGQREVGHDTLWTHAFIDDAWSNAPDWRISEDHPVWVLAKDLLRRVAEDAKGRYLVCAPDLGAAGDLVQIMRGSSPLCLDVIDQPERVRAALEGIRDSWLYAFSEVYRIVMGRGAGLYQWLRLWSNRPYVVPACDFGAVLSPRQFQKLFLPDIARLAAAVGRAVYHLDGPDATRHLDALLEIPEIAAIQFSPGPSNFTALGWVEMFRKIQAKGKSLLVFCPAKEVLALSEALRPEGLAIVVRGHSTEMTSFQSLLAPLPVDELNDLFDAFCQRFGCKQS